MHQHPRPLFLLRALAWIIDSVLLGLLYFLAIVFPAGMILGSASFDIFGFFALSWAYLFVFPLFFVFVHMVYYAILHAWLGQTIGKMIMGIRVVVAGSSVPLPPGRAFLRWCGYSLSLLPLAAGFLWAAVDRDQCAWHDRLAGSRVIPTEIT